MDTTPTAPLAHVRTELYQCVSGMRRDALFEVLDAVLSTEGASGPERTWGRWTGSGLPESGIVRSWEFQWLVMIQEASGSWMLALEVGRSDLEAGNGRVGHRGFSGVGRTHEMVSLPNSPCPVQTDFDAISPTFRHLTRAIGGFVYFSEYSST